MDAVKCYKNSLFVTLATLGLILFIVINLFENTYERINNGEKAKVAIQMLDEMRRPVLAIRNAEYKDLGLESDKKHEAFEFALIAANKAIAQYLESSSYSSELLINVNQLLVELKNWTMHEQKLWDSHLLLNSQDVSKNEPIEIQVLHHQANALFFKVLDVLGAGEKPIHSDIDDGIAASGLFVWSGAILLAYLLIIIIIFQRKRNNDLHTQQVKLEEQVQERTVELELANKELEAFSYSVSHDLRAPLRAIDGFSQALLEDYNHSLDDTGKNYLNRVRSASQKMAQLIDDMLLLSRVSRNQINKQSLDLSELANNIIYDLQKAEPERSIKVIISENLVTYGDRSLIKIALTNLLSNAWKYTANHPNAIIEFGRQDVSGEFYIKDNGVGFDMQYAGKLFHAFQRLHGSEFEGTGIGLATVKRILIRHNGDIRAEAKLNEGSCFYFNINVST